MRHTLFLLLASLTLVSCTFSPKPISVMVKWDLPRSMHRAEPSKSEEMNCYFINVSGPGMPQNYGPGDLANSDPLCMGVTSVFGPYDLETLKAGTKIKVIPGNPRTISVLGTVSGALANECGQHRLPEYFNTASPPQLYTLGSITTRVFIDSAISIQDSYTVSTAEDLVRKCSAGGTTGSTLGNGTIKSVKAFAIESGTDIRQYAYDDTNLQFTSLGTSALTGAPATFRPPISDDLTRYFVPLASGTTRVDIFGLSLTRVASFINTLVAQPGESWSDAMLSPNADNLYAITNNTISTYRHRNNVTTHQSTYGSFTPLALGVTPHFVYVVGSVGSRTNQQIKGYQRISGTIDGIAPILNFRPPMVSAAAGAKILIDRNYQNLYLVAAPMARAFKIGTDGQLTEYGEPLGIGAVQTFAALTRDAKYIITVENSANAAIRAISTNDTGLLLAGGSAGLTGVGSGVFDIVLDPQQKHLFVKTLTSSVIPVSLSFGESILFTQRPALTLVTNGYDAPISTHLDFVPVFEQN